MTWFFIRYSIVVAFITDVTNKYFLSVHLLPKLVQKINNVKIDFNIYTIIITYILH